MIHTTIGVYANGDFKSNGVSSESLQAHIDYNINYRWGRALIVDGEIVYKGYLSEERLNEMLEGKLKNIKHTVDTAPYH